MAYIRKIRGRWKAEIERGGVRTSRTFDLKTTATAWAAREEAAILDGKRGQFPARTVREAFERYESEVSAGKRGARAEGLRFTAVLREFPWLATMVLHEVKTADLARWRDARLGGLAARSGLPALKAVSKGTVQRDINLLRNVWTVAAREWGWCGEPSPWRALRMPGDNPARDQQIKWQEIRRIVRWLGYRTGQRPETKYQEVAWAFMVAMRTAMRAGEVMGLTAETVDLARRVVRLDTHKTLEREGSRYVPITPAGVRLLGVLLTGVKSSPWTIKAASLDALFRKARDACLMGHLHFHDSRAMALTMLARRVDVMTLARISGHRDLNQLLASYYRESAEQIAARL
jgi:integrase